ncbi:MAG: cysteine desulfurase NifS [Candidatus Aenigmatarchaeota archaeon]
MRRIYLDHAATTPVAKEVLEAMEPYFSEKFGNASSLHSFGQEARRALEDSREQVAKLINADSAEIFFTSGGTEADNMAIKGTVKPGDHIITSRIEHHAVLHVCEHLESQGVKVTYLPVDEYGLVDPKEVEKAITKATRLVSIMHANNEIGTIEPIEEIGKICRKHKVLFHTDAVQTFGKVPIDVKKMPIDMLSASSHKLYGPKGVGCLYIRAGTKVTPLLHGGGHESGRRSGTENVAGAVGFAKACETARKKMKDEAKRGAGLRDMLVKAILEIPDTKLNGHAEKRLPGNANFSFRGIEGESLIMYLDMKGIAASTGSACSTKSLEPSHVLTAIGLKPFEAQGSLRLALGKDNTEEDIKYTIEVIKETVENLRKISPFKKEEV